MTEHITYRLAFVALVIGGAAIAMFGGGATRRQVFRTACHTLVCLVGATGYWALMAGQRISHIGEVEIATRSLDWFFVVPLLILSVAVTAAPLGRSIVPMAATAMFLGAVSALASAVAAETVGASVWIWFFVWLVALGLAFGILWQPMAEAAASGHPLRNEIYRRHAGVLTVLLSLFPLAFLLGPDMLGLYGDASFAVIVAVLDVVLMAGYGLLVVFEDEQLVDLELAAEALGEQAGLVDMPEGAAALNAAGGRRLAPGAWEAGAVETLARARRRAERAREVAPPIGRRIAEVARDPLNIGPPPPPRELPRPIRRRRSAPPKGPFTFGDLRGREAVPVTFVAVTLFLIAQTRRKR